MVAKLDFNSLEKKFSILLLNDENAVYSVNAADLLDPAAMHKLVTLYASRIKALDPTAAAAYFAGSFANVALALQYTVSVYNTAIDFSLSNLIIELIPEETYTRVAFCLRTWREEEGPADKEQREDWLQKVYTTFYGDTARPLFDRLSAETGLHIGQLWGQLPTTFHYYLDVFSSELRQSTVTRLLADYTILCHQMDPAVFGCRKNPFDVRIRMVESLQSPDKLIRLKNKCCLYVKTDGGSYCYTCPRLTEADRAERRRMFRKHSIASRSS